MLYISLFSEFVFSRNREIEHPNVLSILGQCTESPPLLVILEQAPFVSFSVVHVLGYEREFKSTVYLSIHAFQSEQ